ncbi:MAG: hypothetical protein ABW105_07520 [Candidatus Thiodiazotropha sp. 6PLUC1]
MTAQFLSMPVITLSKLDNRHNTVREDHQPLVLLGPLEVDVQIDRLCIRATTDTGPGVISLYSLFPGEEDGLLISQVEVVQHKKSSGSGVWQCIVEPTNYPLFPLKLEKGFTILATLTSKDQSLGQSFDVTLLGGTLTGRAAPLYQDRYLFEQGAIGEKPASGLAYKDYAYLPMRNKEGASAYRIDHVWLHVPGNKWPRGESVNNNIATVNLVIGQQDNEIGNEITSINLKNYRDGRSGAHVIFDKSHLFPLFLPVSHYLGVRIAPDSPSQSIQQLYVHFIGGYIDE